jgi:rootletin
MEAVHLVETKETTIQNISNSLEKMREDKMSLEELEQTLKTVLIEKDKKIESLERQMSDTKAKMTAEVGALKEKLTRSEMEMKANREKAEQEKGSIETKFMKELTAVKSMSGSNEEKIKSDFEERLKVLRSDLEGERKNDVTKLNGEINSLRQQIDSLRVQYEEALLRAENDKQQGLLLAQQDQQGLSDKIRLLERELDDLRNEKGMLR